MHGQSVAIKLCCHGLLLPLVSSARDDKSGASGVFHPCGPFPQRWVGALSDAHGYGSEGACARIYTFGSFRLGVHSPGEPCMMSCGLR